MRPLTFNYGKVNGIPSPLIPLGLGYQGHWARVEAYVDSGSLYSLFRAELATGLGIVSLKRARKSIYRASLVQPSPPTYMKLISS